MGTRRIRHGCGGRHRGHCAVPLPPPFDNRKAAIKLALHAAADLFAAAGHSARKDGPDIDRRGPAARHSGEPFRFRRLENGARPMHAPLRAHPRQPARFVSTPVRHASSLISWIGSAPSAAQPTSMSSAPSSPSTASKSASTPSRLARSAVISETLPRRSRTPSRQSANAL